MEKVWLKTLCSRATNEGGTCTEGVMTLPIMFAAVVFAVSLCMCCIMQYTMTIGLVVAATSYKANQGTTARPWSRFLIRGDGVLVTVADGQLRNQMLNWFNGAKVRSPTGGPELTPVFNARTKVAFNNMGGASRAFLGSHFPIPLIADPVTGTYRLNDSIRSLGVAASDFIPTSSDVGTLFERPGVVLETQGYEPLMRLFRILSPTSIARTMRGGSAYLIGESAGSNGKDISVDEFTFVNNPPASIGYGSGGVTYP